MTDTASGKAPRNAGISVTVTHYDWSVDGTVQTSWPLTGVTNAAGLYSIAGAPFGIDIVGGDTVSARYSVPRTSNQVTVNATAPYVIGFLDRAHVSGYALPNAKTLLTIKNRMGKLVFTAECRTSLSGQFSLVLTDGLGSTTLRPNMGVALDLPGVSVTLPRVGGRLNVGAKRVDGFGPPNLYIRISTQSPFFTHYGQIDKRGRFSVDLSPGGGVSEGTLVSLVVRLAGGDLVYRYIE